MIIMITMLVWFCALVCIVVSMFDDKSCLNNLDSGSILFEPPKNIGVSYYRCDNKFHLDNILEMYNDETKFGIVVVTGEETKCYQLIKSGSHLSYNLITKKTGHLQKRQKKGGQSAQRIGRIRQEIEDAYVKEITQKIVECFVEDGVATIPGIILAGPAHLKRSVAEDPQFQQYFNLLKVVPTDKVDDATIYKISEQCYDVICSEEQKEDLQLVNRIEEMVALADDKLIFGYDEAIDNLSMCMLETVVISSKVERMDELLGVSANGTSSCKIKIVDEYLMNKLGVDIVGIRWY